MDLMSKLKEKQGASPMDPQRKAAKMSMLQELRDSMSGMMKDDLSNAKGPAKVTVAGSDPAAVASGLDKAKQMVGSPDGASEGPEGSAADTEGEGDEGQEGIEEIVSELTQAKLSSEEIDMLMQTLQKKKQEMSSDAGGGPGKFGF